MTNKIINSLRNENNSGASGENKVPACQENFKDLSQNPHKENKNSLKHEKNKKTRLMKKVMNQNRKKSREETEMVIQPEIKPNFSGLWEFSSEEAEISGKIEFHVKNAKIKNVKIDADSEAGVKEVRENTQIKADIVALPANKTDFDIKKTEVISVCLKKDVKNNLELKGEVVGRDVIINKEILEKENQDSKTQMEKDRMDYLRSKKEYITWDNKIKELKTDVERAFRSIEYSSDEAVSILEKMLEKLNEDRAKIMENRIKGISMIGKMCKNVQKGPFQNLESMCADNFEIKELQDIDKNLSDEEREELENENYSVISEIENEKNSIIRKYFSFIETNILPIIDGVDSGILYAENSEDDLINKNVLDMYKEMHKEFDDMLSKHNITKIPVELKNDVDFEIEEIIDIENTLDETLDEKISCVIRNGYEYQEDIYNIGRNHVVRPAQVIVYKVEN